MARGYYSIYYTVVHILVPSTRLLEYYYGSSSTARTEHSTARTTVVLFGERELIVDTGLGALHSSFQN